VYIYDLNFDESFMSGYHILADTEDITTESSASSVNALNISDTVPCKQFLHFYD
jgi:hypothetical protein